jgi:hypothetical protein
MHRGQGNHSQEPNFASEIFCNHYQAILLAPLRALQTETRCKDETGRLPL